jgi:glycyl-tRNA synthetase beta chain
VVGIADRADTLVAIFSVGQRPTGNKDPFALRRCALGLVRILLEGGIGLGLERLLALAANELSTQGIACEPAVLAELRDFIAERARSLLRDNGHAAEMVNAVMASGWDNLVDLNARLLALTSFIGQDSGLGLAAANKRIGNILRKADFRSSVTIDEKLLVIDEEGALFRDVVRTEQILDPLLKAREYARCLDQLARLRPTVDAFFEGVMVMDENPALRDNRLALLARLKSQFDQIADLSVLG